MKHFVAINTRKDDTWRMRMVLTALVIAALGVLPGTATAFDLEENLKALHPQYEPAAVLHVAQSGGPTLQQAIEQVKRRTKGKVISAETKVQGGREVHHIKVLTDDGKVKTHKVNGKRR